MRPLKRVRDEWLALRCQAGEPGAFADLIAEMERPLFYYVSKLTNSQDAALDIIQDLWLRTLPGIQRLKEAGSVRAWLYRAAHGLAIDHIRRDIAREKTIENFVGLEEPSTETHFDNDQAIAIHEALDKLDDAHREVLVLHFMEDFSLAEISRIVDCPEGTVKSRLHYAKKALRKLLSGEMHAQSV
jgi:RNA polymerase sigma-70 factor, ECF subfamily